MHPQCIELVPSFSAEWYEPYKGAVLVSWLCGANQMPTTCPSDGT